MKDKITPILLEELKDRYEIVDIIAALSICIMSTGMGIMTAISYFPASYFISFSLLFTKCQS